MLVGTCCLLPLQITILMEEKNLLALENKTLREQKCSLESDAAGLTGKKLLLLQSQIEQLQEENFRQGRYLWGGGVGTLLNHQGPGNQVCLTKSLWARLENGRDDFRVRCEDLEKEVQELQRRNEELTSLAEEAQALKDEMDVLR